MKEVLNNGVNIAWSLTKSWFRIWGLPGLIQNSSLVVLNGINYLMASKQESFHNALSEELTLLAYEMNQGKYEGVKISDALKAYCEKLAPDNARRVNKVEVPQAPMPPETHDKKSKKAPTAKANAEVQSAPAQEQEWEIAATHFPIFAEKDLIKYAELKSSMQDDKVSIFTKAFNWLDSLVLEAKLGNEFYIQNSSGLLRIINSGVANLLGKMASIAGLIWDALDPTGCTNKFLTTLGVSPDNFKIKEGKLVTDVKVITPPNVTVSTHSASFTPAYSNGIAPRGRINMSSGIDPLLNSK